jgi:hypothetical protein
MGHRNVTPGRIKLYLPPGTPRTLVISDGVSRRGSSKGKTMKLFLKLLFGFIFLFMVVMTVRTSLQVSLWNALPSFAASPWAMATLYDAYFGFLTFFCWLAWRERSLGLKILWFVLIMAGGNIAMSLYVLLQLFGLKPEESVSALFRQKAA